MDGRASRVTALVMSTGAFTVCFACWVMNAILVTFLVTRGILALTEAQVGSLLAAPVLTGALSRLPLGVLTDRFGGRRVLTGLMAFSAVPMFAVSQTSGFVGLLFASLGFGLVGGSFAVGVGYVTLFFPRNQQGTALGIFGMGNAGAALTTLVAPRILAAATGSGADPEGWRVLPQVYAALLVVAALVFFLATSHRVAAEAPVRSLRGQLAPLRDIVVWRFGLYYALVFGSFVALAQWIVPYTVSVYEISIAQAGVIAAAFILPSGLVRAAGGILSDRFGARTVMLWVFLGSAVVCVLLSVPRMDLRSPGEGVIAKAPGIVTTVAADAIQVGERRYPVRPVPAEAGAPAGVLPQIRSWQEPAVAPAQAVASQQLLARGVTAISYSADIRVFVTLAFLFGVLTGVGSAGVFRFIPDQYPGAVGVVGGTVGVLGALGGFLFPLLFGYLLRATGLWSSCWVVLAVLSVGCLVLLQRVSRRIVAAEAPDLAQLLEHRPSTPLSPRASGTKESATVEDLLKRVTLFADLSDEQLAEISEIVERHTTQAHATIFEEGDPGNRLYVIADGSVRVLRTGLDGTEIELATLGAGESFGELALIDGAPRSATVRTAEPCEFLVIDRTDFLKLLSRYPRMLADFLVGMSTRIRESSVRLYDLALQKEHMRAQQEIDRHRSLGEMIAGLAHEVNTPIGIVNHAASIIVERLDHPALQSGELDADTRDAIADAREASVLVQQNIGRADRLVRSFKQLSVHQVASDRETVDLRELTREVAALYRLKARTSGLTVEVVSHLDDGSSRWVGYPGHYAQVLLNLLTNVDRYAYEPGAAGRVDICLSHRTLRDGTGQLTVEVRDFGRGIAPEHRDRVLEPFFTTGRAEGGTGLGLAIVASLVSSSLGGDVEVQSQPGSGTSVVLQLPSVAPEPPVIEEGR